MRQLLLVVGLLICYKLTAQFTVQGIVYDNDRKPLPGVNVIELRGGEPGAVTDINGKFTLYCYHQTPTLYFNYYKFITDIVEVDSTYFVSIKMEPENRKNFKKYEGKRVDKLISNISENILSKKIITRPQGFFNGIEIELRDSSVLKVYLKEPRFTDQSNKDRFRDWGRTGKERIERINHFL